MTRYVPAQDRHRSMTYRGCGLSGIPRSETAPRVVPSRFAPRPLRGSLITRVAGELVGARRIDSFGRVDR